MASGQRTGEGSGGGMEIGLGGLWPARVEVTARGGGGSEYFECRTCSRRFTSFQALGGHRTGHTRMEARRRQEQEQEQGQGHRGGVEVRANRRQAASECHPCAVCGLEFRMGQALGGHMRRHRAVVGVEQPEMLDLNSPPVVAAGEGDQEVERAEPEPRLLNLLRWTDDQIGDYAPVGF